MHLFFRKILLICCCSFVFARTIAQVNFYTIASPAVINKGDYFTYKIVFKNPGSIMGLPAPNLNNFTIIKGPEQINEVRQEEGKLIPFISLEYLLKPKGPGRFTIKPLVVIIGGKKCRSNASSIVVNNTSFKDLLTGGVPRPAMSDFILHKGDSLADKINKNMQLRIELDRKSCYVGEPIIATYKLYSRLQNEIGERHNSSFNGFSVVDMLSSDTIPKTRGFINGKEYNVSTLRQAQLYPLQSGVINLESAQLETEVRFVKEEYAILAKDTTVVYNDFENGNLPAAAEIVQVITLKSIPVDIMVKPLPEKNRPVSFNGAVGNFQIRAALQKGSFSTDEAGKLLVSILGAGNMRLLTAPEIKWPAGIESFEPKFSENLTGATVPVSGIKRFEYAFAPNDSGHYTIPAIHFSYFDPATETYQTVSTEPILFQVSKGDGHPVDLSQLAAVNERPSFLNRIFNHRWWIIVFIGVVMFTALFMWVIRDKKPGQIQPAPIVKEEDAVINERIGASAIDQQNVFPETEKCLYEDDCFGFYSLLNTELRTYLANKFSIDAHMINSNSIIAVMDKKAIPNDIVLKLQGLMQTIEWQLYTPFERNDKIKELYHEAHETVQMINACFVTHL